MTGPGVATRIEAAEYLGVSVRSLDTLIKNGVVKRVAYSGRVLVPWSHLFDIVPDPRPPVNGVVFS